MEYQPSSNSESQCRVHDPGPWSRQTPVSVIPTPQSSVTRPETLPPGPRVKSIPVVVELD